ncbi:AsnC family transcriptional regulator [Sphingobium sp. CR2-8]|uniref:AsnC family transcriptional regulator n=1 Tax=Sphingobium sp. CR2-8 TaxID=1306534 RepID=UPI003FA3672A
MTNGLDDPDRAILRLLKLNARRSNADIAVEVGLSPPPATGASGSWKRGAIFAATP